MCMCFKINGLLVVLEILISMFFACCCQKDSMNNQRKKTVHFIEPDTPPAVVFTREGKLKVHRFCTFCRMWPCYMDRDENYERILVLGTALEAEGWNADQIRAAIQSEMSYQYSISEGGGFAMPYCVGREINDAYPPEKKQKQRRNSVNNKSVVS
jgi:hypothetical protein